MTNAICSADLTLILVLIEDLSKFGVIVERQEAADIRRCKTDAIIVEPVQNVAPKSGS